MKFEVLPNKKKRLSITLLIIGVVAIVGIATFSLTRAKYKYTNNLPLIRANNISYSKSDLEIVAIKLKDGDSYTDTDTVPTSGYTLNTTESICKDKNEATINTTFEYKDGKVYIDVTKKGTKCTMVFDKKLDFASMLLAANGGESAIKAKGNPDFSKTSCTSGTYNGTERTCEEDTTGMWAMEDDYGTSYYFRGSPTNNYVKFAGYYWRIIRINGDGTIRMIYDGTSYHSNGTSTANSIAVSSKTFSPNSNAYNNNAYVGYTYATGSKRGTGSSSYAKKQIDSWYTSSGLSSYSNYLADSGFCGDRTSTTTIGEIPNNTGGTGTTTTYYGVYYRLHKNKIPTLKCSTISYGSDSSYEKGNKADVYTISTTKGNGELQYPIGLISADEVAVAGGVSSTTNYSYYLYNGQYYWTMSPILFNNAGAVMFDVDNSGSLNSYSVKQTFGLRPVINLDSTKINNITMDSNGVYVVS